MSCFDLTHAPAHQKPFFLRTRYTAVYEYAAPSAVHPVPVQIFYAIDRDIGTICVVTDCEAEETTIQNTEESISQIGTLDLKKTLLNVGPYISVVIARELAFLLPFSRLPSRGCWMVLREHTHVVGRWPRCWW